MSSEKHTPDEPDHAAAITRRLMRVVGQRVEFTKPDQRRGILQHREIVKSGADEDAAYWDVVDVIQFEGEPEPWVRVGYYRLLPTGRLVFAGQTTITEPRSLWRRGLLPALQRAVGEHHGGLTTHRDERSA